MTEDPGVRAAELQGYLLIERKTADLITGRVINDRDVDFDITIDGVARRDVGRIRADTVEGSWIQISDGGSGSFRAMRWSAAP